MDDEARNHLHDELRWVRAAVLDTLDGLSGYEVRRPLTTTGTNLLGLVQHLTTSEIVYLGDLFGRRFPEPVPRFDDPGFRNRDSLWVRPETTRAEVIARYRRACAHADATIQGRPLRTPARVPWWPRPDITLFDALLHVVTETNRHAGHADILREQLLDSTDADWTAHRARVEDAARQAPD